MREHVQNRPFVNPLQNVLKGGGLKDRPPRPLCTPMYPYLPNAFTSKVRWHLFLSLVRWILYVCIHKVFPIKPYIKGYFRLNPWLWSTYCGQLQENQTRNWSNHYINYANQNYTILCLDTFQFIHIDLLEVLLPDNPICPSVGRSVVYLVSGAIVYILSTGCSLNIVFFLKM